MAMPRFAPIPARLRHTSLAALAAGALALAALAALACSGDEGTLTVYSGRSQNLIGPLLDEFAEDTGIKVEVRYDSAVNLALLLQEEGERTPADVFISRSPGPIAFLAERGMLAPLDDDLLARAPSSPSGYWVALTGRQRVLVYNAELLDEADLPASVHDLVEEEWLGRVAIAPSNGSFQDFFTLFRLEVGDEAALAWLTALREGGAPVLGNNSGIVQAVARGEIEMGLVNHYYNLRFKAEDPSIASENHYFADGDPGGVTIATAAGALASGDQDLAARFIRYMLGREAQRYFGTQTHEYPLATGLDLGEVNAVPVGPIDLGEFDRLGSGLQRTLELIREAGFNF